MIHKRYQSKLKEEIELIADNYYEIGTTDAPAYYFGVKDLIEKAVVQMKETPRGIVFFYSIILKKLETDSADGVLTVLSENWDLVETFLWPMEINDAWYLLASKKITFETYLPGQIKNQLSLIHEEVRKNPASTSFHSEASH